MSDYQTRIATSLADRYAIERELGQGGMATVYLAQDIKHHRKVAIKVLHPELSAVLGTDRFLKEIELTANLQHPHILPLHDSGEADGLVYYVMPYVEGESLRHRLNREKQLPIDEAVRIAKEVADALDYAHRRGVVHRDIKPENILLHDGRVQVADFGIALAVTTAGAGTRMTETGMSLGTPQYMSPEQAMGERDVSAKSDIYALGCVLYEMLIGEPPFTGPTPQAIVARIVTEEPRSITLQRRAVPPELESVVQKALEKLPADRFANAAQFADALAHPEQTAIARKPGREGRTTRPRGTTSAARTRFAVPALAALAAVAIILAVWGWTRDRSVAPAPLARFTLEVPATARFVDAIGTAIVMSPDGSKIVYIGADERGQRQLFLRGLDQLDPSPIPGTRDALGPFFSPDGRWLAFTVPGKLVKISMSGGPPLTITAVDSGFLGATWGDGDVVVLATDGGLRQVPAAGGRPTEVTIPDTAREVAHALPSFLPGGRAVLFHVRGTDQINRIAAVDLSKRAIKRFDITGANPRYVEPGHVVIANTDGTLTSAPFDARRLEFTGSAVPLAEGVLVGAGGAAELAMSRTGAFAYVTGQGGVRSVVSVDRRGSAQPLTTELRTYGSPRVSPDGRRIAVEIQEGPGSAIWVFDIAQKTLTRLTFDRDDIRPFWTPDGTRIAFTRGMAAPDIWWVRADGSALPESLLVTRGRQLGDTWSPDGRILVYHQNNAAATRNDIMLRFLDSAGTTRPYLQTPADEFTPVVSPDGRWLAYASDESGRLEVYVRSFPEPGEKFQISLDGGMQPRWSANGRELFYRTGDRMLSAAVVTQPRFTVTQRSELFRGTFNSFQFHAQYDVTRDGRFIMLQGPQATSDIVVVLNWFENLRRGAPAGTQ